MKALILVNGELYKPGILRRRVRAEQFDLVIGADRGAHHAGTLGVRLDAVIGDMDSLSDAERGSLGRAEFISYPAEKDETDLELALLYTKEKGAAKIVLAGAMGGRMDMSIANINLIAHDSLVSCRVEVWHGDETGWLIRPPGGEICGQPEDTVSLIPLGGDASGVTTEGMKYPLRDETLSFAPGRGVSNVIKELPVRVGLSGGLLLAVHIPGRLSERR